MQGAFEKCSRNYQRTISKVAGGRLRLVGLGYMGSHTAKRPLRAGYPLVVFNRNRAKSEAA
jgi:6-phosphogluconate dehydrogenase